MPNEVKNRKEFHLLLERHYWLSKYLSDRSKSIDQRNAQVLQTQLLPVKKL
jgi:hypothetical protein